MNPFVVLGVPPTMDLNADELERRYLELSRQTHPDRNRSESQQQQIAVLARSAKLNDAYRQLRDPWSRAKTLLSLRRPGILESTKQLCPIFLTEAMELSEEIAETAATDVADLAARVDARVEAYLDTIRTKIEAEDWEGASTSLHESRYYRKAQQELRAQT